MTRGDQRGLLPTACLVPDMVACGLVRFSSFFHSVMGMFSVLQGRSIVLFLEIQQCVLKPLPFSFFHFFFFNVMANLELSRRKALCASSGTRMDSQYL